MKMLWKVIALVTCVLTVSSPIYAASDTLENGRKKDYVRGFFITLPVEFPFADLSALNTGLTAAGIPECHLPTATAGLGYLYQRNRFVFNLSVNMGNRKAQPNFSEVVVEYRSYGLNAGYDVIKAPSFSLLPYAGLKYNTLKYESNQLPRNGISFNNYVNTNYDHKELRNNLLHADFGLSFSHQQFYYLGIRAGYLVPLHNLKWGTADKAAFKIENVPDIKYMGYISVSIGIGYLSSGKKEQEEDEIMLDDLQ